MKLKNAALLLLTALTVGSCKKSASVNPANNVVLNGIFIAANTKTVSSLYMYTKNGRITNQDTINAYIARHPHITTGPGGFIISGSSSPADYSGLQFNFLNSETAIRSFTEATNMQTDSFTVTKKTNAGFLLEAVDTSLTFKDSYPPPPRCEVLMNNSNTLNELSYPRIFPSNNSVGFDTAYTFRQAYPFEITNNKLYLSLYSCFISNYQLPLVSGSIAEEGFYEFNGTFNTVVLKQLAAGDTLLYQNETCLFNKK